MLKKNRYTKMIAGVLMAGFLITTGSLAIAKAASDTTAEAGTQTSPSPVFADRGFQMIPEFNEVLSGLVNDSVITEEQAQAIITACEQKMQQRHEERVKQHQEQISAKLDTLVEEGTINASQSQAILEIMAQKQQEQQAEMDKLKAMTEEERQKYLENNRPERPAPGTNNDISPRQRPQMSKLGNPLQALVDNNTLTQEQADAVIKVLMQGFKNR